MHWVRAHLKGWRLSRCCRTSLRCHPMLVRSPEGALPTAMCPDHHPQSQGTPPVVVLDEQSPLPVENYPANPCSREPALPCRSRRSSLKPTTLRRLSRSDGSSRPKLIPEPQTGTGSKP